MQSGTKFFFAEQMALNYVIFAEHLPVNFLPAYCNWMPGDAPPAFDPGRGLFVEPYALHEAIGVMHLAGREQKTHLFRLDRLDGGTVETSLRYSESLALCDRSLTASSLLAHRLMLGEIGRFSSPDGMWPGCYSCLVLVTEFGVEGGRRLDRWLRYCRPTRPDRA